MDTLVTVVHFITAFLIVALVLMQQGKGAEMGASFGGGGSQTVFGSSGGGSFFGKLTAIMAVVFFVTSLGLALFARQDSRLNIQSDLPVLESIQVQQQNLESETSEIEEIPTSPANDDVESPTLEMPTE
ncbi:MAG: preprotein translocase subunit SecG [Pseudomonadales bacterium]